MKNALLILFLASSLPLAAKAGEDARAVEMTVVLKSPGGEKILAPKLTTKSGQKGRVEFGREFAHGRGNKIMTGGMFEACPTIENDRLAASGWLTFRKPLPGDGASAAHFTAFQTSEALFDVRVENGETIEISLADGSKAAATFRIVPRKP